MWDFKDKKFIKSTQRCSKSFVGDDRNTSTTALGGEGQYLYWTLLHAKARPASDNGSTATMSTLYNLEPPPTAKVLLTTTAGDLLLELFAKQIPLASRSFLQHCLDGYYDGTVFHRLVPGFILQGGDPTGTGEGGESVFEGRTFEDEFHSRLKWNRRGLLGMANEGKKGTNGSQFFFSLGDCKELEGRNTLFGRIVGDTIFNLLKMSEAELGDGGRPLYPTKIIGAEVLVNPFEDMLKREIKRTEIAKGQASALKKSKKKGGKTLLSFAGGEDEMEEPAMKKQKFNPALVDNGIDARDKDRIPVRQEGKAAPKMKANDGPQVSSERKPKPTKRSRSFSSQSPQPRTEPPPATQLPLRNEEVPSRSPSVSPEPVEKMTSVLDKTNAQIAELKASMKRNITAAPVKEAKPKSALESLMPANAVRGKRKGGLKEEKRTLDLLDAFRSKLDTAAPGLIKPDTQGTPGLDIPETNGQTVDENNDEEAELCDLHFIANCQSCKSWDEHSGDEGGDEEKGWMSHVLSFEKDRLGKDLTWKRKNEEELLVIDPREKAKDIRDEQRAKKLAKAGGSTAWAKDRDRGREPGIRAGGKG